jgi:hypothetical protein
VFIGAYMSISEVAEYRQRTDEALDRLAREQDPDARAHWRQLALEYSRLVDLIAMREGVGRKLAVSLRRIGAVSASVDLSVLEV